MGGGYIPGNNYGDDVGFDEVIRPEECSDSGLDSLAYAIFNPNIDPPNGAYSDTTTITFCVHGVNDPPIMFDINDKSFDEDTVYEIPITINQSPLIDNLIVNSEHITVYDPDSLYNSIDIEYSNPNEDYLELSINNDILYVSPENNINGDFQITITAKENYDLDNDGNPDYSSVPDPALEVSETFSITINEVNDAPVMVDIPNQNTLEATSLSLNLNASDDDGETNFIFYAESSSDLFDLVLDESLLTINPILNNLRIILALTSVPLRPDVSSTIP